MSILEARIPLQHKVWREDAGRDSHGNKTGTFDPPVDRLAIDVYPLGVSALSRVDQPTVTSVVRSETDLIIDVDDPTIYGAQDEVILLGVKFKVQGDSAFSSWDNMPIDGYQDIVPGSVHVKRVT